MDLVAKYNVPGPRYTSYPTVPYWDRPPSVEEWKGHVRASFRQYNEKDGVSIYIHLPYCESLCTFCGCTTRITVNHAVEGPYIDALLAEWKLYTGLFEGTPHIREIHLGGGTPTFFSPANLARLVRGLKAAGRVDEMAELGLEANPNTVTYEHLETLAGLGFTRLSLGIQDFDSRVQHAIHRVQTFEQVKQIMDWARALGYTSINFDLVYGLPFQTVHSIEHTISLVNRLRPDRIAYYSYAHVPWIKPGQRSFTELDLPEGLSKHRLYALGKEMFVNAGYVEIGMDHFALPADPLHKAMCSGTLHRNFMGYTTQPGKLLIGLGASAISDTWTAFAQNVKAVEAYLEKIRLGEFPIFRGHILTGEDLWIRQVILDLMCHFRADIPEQKLGRFEENLSALGEMENDALVKIHRGHIEVCEAGRPFVRNICMAFDQRLREKQGHTQLFSMTV